MDVYYEQKHVYIPKSKTDSRFTSDFLQTPATTLERRAVAHVN